MTSSSWCAGITTEMLGHPPSGSGRFTPSCIEIEARMQDQTRISVTNHNMTAEKETIKSRIMMI
jgi:hypothetical protein